MAPLAEVCAPTSLNLDETSIVKQKKMMELHETQKVLEPQCEAACEADNNEKSFASKAFTLTTQRDTETVEIQESQKKHVRFDVADVVEFEPTLWTATVSSEGVPLGMSVDVRCRTKRLIDLYENERVLLRVDRQVYMDLGYLEPEERLEILENAGHSISIISHVERETLRINRGRWESNEYDLMYQYGLGDVPLMMDNDMEMVQQDDGDEIMHADDCNDLDFIYGAGVRNIIMDSEVRFVMEDLDAYDFINTRTYEDLSVAYTSDCILGDNESSDEYNELPYDIDSFDCPLSCESLEMGSSPSDVSSTSDCMLLTTTAASYALYASSKPTVSNTKEVIASVEAKFVAAT
ncbi:uncharacterized protein PHALS_10988 [Plasmopara halstedii]|uniref:Uncharacterized protein n=1 Tax=Plasmopara halstedii TaxID=4781 RepID=A0A0P1AJ56_PLAHL|nr:uncharacterized protein PHALS_10988 [Plasmopara halstedii]CEG40807.1 hypothetical protein PHALS_10988 [Plasmopara halstedii]|eukprot:XP_024577176.1 hypothetical protein PHALS_10988 [Plasmopara halstedii]